MSRRIYLDFNSSTPICPEAVEGVLTRKTHFHLERFTRSSQRAARRMEIVYRYG